MLRSKTFRMIATFAFLLVFASSAYAFTNSNIVRASYAGSGSGNISGYVVENINYVVSNDGTKITAVHFDIASNTDDAVVPANFLINFAGGSGATYGGGAVGSECWQTDAGSNPSRMVCNVDEGISNVTDLTVTAWN